VSHLTERVKYVVKVYQNLALGYLCNVVHALASVVSYSGILIGEAGENRRDDFFEIAGNFLGSTL
jgi:hypothetical protein